MTMKRVILLAAVILTGCREESPFVGKWRQTPPEVEDRGVWARIITLRKDGAGKIRDALVNSDGLIREEITPVAWSARGKEATITVDGDAAFNATIDGSGNLVLEEIGVAVRRCERLPIGDDG